MGLFDPIRGDDGKGINEGEQEEEKEGIER